MAERNCEKLLKRMKEEFRGSKEIIITTMKTAKTCNVNNLPLEEDDLYIAEHLKTGYMVPDGETYKVIKPLKAGDVVLMIKVNEEKYAIVERLVEA